MSATDSSWDWFEADLPWRVHRGLADTYAHHGATLPLGELFFALTALVLTLAHACEHGRRHVVVWISALISGTANDIFFMVLPFVDNFWHAQCSLMLTPRLPAYIPCVYICFMYIGTVSAWRLHLSALPTAAATGLTAAIYYAPYDLVGAKFLWWTWHDTDAAVAERWLGVPIGSTMWTLVHCTCFSLVVHWAAGLSTASHPGGGEKPMSKSGFLGTILATAIVTTPFMMVAMGPFQLHQTVLSFDAPSGLLPFTIEQMPGRPDPIAIALVLITLLTTLEVGLVRERGKPPSLGWLKPDRTYDMLLFATVVVHFTFFVAAMAFGEPEHIVATGVHQEFGQCHVEGHDLSNFPRFEFLCADDYDEDFDFGCPTAAARNLEVVRPPGFGVPDFKWGSEGPQTWYTVCGREHTRHWLYIMAQVCFAVAGTLLYRMMLLGPRSVNPKSHIQ